ncbi:unnamed protein product [Linum trigynum]|uniref:F-box domain-containing protein n=1 Tax=Linum trigynum TaxID=586398 RepID=A0AAV2EJB9_9ROSI
MEAENTTEIARPKPEIDADDRLSSLPDDVISHILSFLPTKYAVGTAVLSRRWKDLWIRVSNLDFDNCLLYQPLPGNFAVHNLPPDEQRMLMEDRERKLLEFSRFVYKVPSQHKSLDSVRRFRFHFTVEYSKSGVCPGFQLEREWVFGPLVEEIDILIEALPESGRQWIRCLPQSFYTLKNLKVVKLHGVILSAAEGSVLLPSVKILQLCEVEFRDCESVSSLISGCPVLETALLEGGCLSHRNEQDVLIVSLPSLKNLKIIRFGNYDKCHIVIEAPVLEELDLQDFVDLEFVGSSPLACLHSAHFDIGPYQSSDLSLDGVLDQISYAKKMFISGDTLHHLSAFDHVQFPDFPNLTHLTTQTGASSLVLLSLLDSAPKLQSLVIDMGTATQAMRLGCELFDLWTPECLLSSLEEIEVKDLVPNEDDMKLVAYLLEAGAVLKKVDMHVQHYHHDIKGRKKLASLLELPRGSSCCEARLLLSNNEEICIDSNKEAVIDDDMNFDDYSDIEAEMDDDDDFDDFDGDTDDD